uniref:Uncharacterized protein n=1 Tax=Plectus sambesii TaxID=2011161 RepID=A0A914WNB1_9BILA
MHANKNTRLLRSQREFFELKSEVVKAFMLIFRVVAALSALVSGQLNRRGRCGSEPGFDDKLARSLPVPLARICLPPPLRTIDFPGQATRGSVAGCRGESGEREAPSHRRQTAAGRSPALPFAFSSRLPCFITTSSAPLPFLSHRDTTRLEHTRASGMLEGVIEARIGRRVVISVENYGRY